jgi:hypothetical protein
MIIRLKETIATSIEKKLLTHDAVGILRLYADHAGLAYFPDTGEAVIDPVLTQELWQEHGVQQQWMPKFGLGVGAFVNLGGVLQTMDWQKESSGQFENAFEESISDPMWVVKHAELAREAMLAEVERAALWMAVIWNSAMKIPETHALSRWQATSMLGFLRRKRS